MGKGNDRKLDFWYLGGQGIFDIHQMSKGIEVISWTFEMVYVQILLVPKLNLDIHTVA